MNKKKNLLFILTDDQGAWALGANGNKDIKTPTLDRIAKEGVNFSNFFCASPVCSPARATILTGTMPSTHGVIDWICDGNFNKSDREYTKNNMQYGGESKAIQYTEGMTAYTDILKNHGYSCNLVGKWHLGDSFTPQHGFDFWTAIPLGYSKYLNSDIIENGNIHDTTGYVTDVLTDKAIDRLKELAKESKDSDKPFYMSLHYSAPHSPWSRCYQPDYVHDQYNDCNFDYTPMEETHKNAIYTCDSPYYGMTESESVEGARKELLSGYYGAITEVDKNVGRILKLLQELEIDKDTIIIFTADNGMNLGQHGIWGKGNGTYPQNMYDSSVKVPFIIYESGREGKETFTNLYSQYDIFPTIMELLNVQLTEEEKNHMGTLPGNSFAKEYVNGENVDEDKMVVVYSEYGKVRMVRSKKYKFVRVYVDGFEDELYDLINDPNERNNLVGKKEYEEVERNMRDTLENWFINNSNNERSGLLNDVYGTGQRGINSVNANENESPFTKGEAVGENYLEFTARKSKVFNEKMLPLVKMGKKMAMEKIDKEKIK